MTGGLWRIPRDSLPHCQQCGEALIAQRDKIDLINLNLVTFDLSHICITVRLIVHSNNLLVDVTSTFSVPDKICLFKIFEMNTGSLQ